MSDMANERTTKNRNRKMALEGVIGPYVVTSILVCSFFRIYLDYGFAVNLISSELYE
jgi:hypothetical protein